jgi:uncharacterized protein (DUF433 family)
MATHPRITRNPDIAFGKPAITGTRVSVEFVLELLAAGWSESEILSNYPHLTRDDILACLAYAHDVVEETGSVSHAAE